MAAGDDTPERGNALLLSFFWFCAIVFVVWLFTAGRSYRENWAHSVEGFTIGSTRLVEVTVVATDRTNLACAAEQSFGDELHCGFHADGGVEPAPALQPFVTVNGELLLATHLWDSPKLQTFTGRIGVVCNFHVVSVTRQASIRFAPEVAFASVGKLVPVGTFSDCVFP